MEAIQLSDRFGAVDAAELPRLYVEAKDRLAKCESVDECRSWADKAEAIRSYARQAKDDELMAAAMRIKSRAVERLGSLLEDLEKAQGRRRDLLPASAPSSPRQAAREAAGISEKQAAQAQAVARFAEADPEQFSALVEGERPATVTELAKRGRRKIARKDAPACRRDLRQMAALVRRLSQRPVAELVADTTSRRDIAAVIAWVDSIRAEVV